MECKLEVPAVSVSCHSNNEIIGIGHIDGTVSIQKLSFRKRKIRLEKQWTKHHKRSVRRVAFSTDGTGLFSITQNRALCLWDVETGKKVRLLRRAHDEPPYALDVLPTSSTKGQQVATGDETGVIRSWDFRAALPQICEFHEQEEVINELRCSDRAGGSVLLSASADGTLAAYNMRSRKLIVRSEPMHSDLLSVCVAVDGRTYAGAGDGEWGNIVGRIDTIHKDTIDCVACISPKLLVTASSLDDNIGLINLNPNKRLGKIGVHEDGVEQLVVTKDGGHLISIGLSDVIKFWNIRTVVNDAPTVNSSHKVEKSSNLPHTSGNNFFDGLNDDGDESDNSERSESGSGSGGDSSSDHERMDSDLSDSSEPEKSREESDSADS